MNRRGSPNFDTRPDGLAVTMLVFHYTGMADADAAVARLCDPQSKVSAHYLVHEDGRVVALVDEANRAWHAGEAFWRGITDINGCSVGIEMHNPGHEFGYRDFPGAQIAALGGLAREILARHPIPAGNVVGHSDVAPRRKQDPGERFPWRRLAQDGVGLWPEATAAGEPGDGDRGQAAGLLSAIGYETVDVEASLCAFQRRFRPACMDGAADGETMGLLRALARLTT